MLNTNSASHIVNNIKYNWCHLIDQPGTTELECLRFVSQHAGFFFANSYGFCLVIAELRLGSDYRTDFVLPDEDWSEGVHYTLIEFESPNSPPFNSKSVPSGRLSEAVQQIQNWRSWIAANREEARRILPSGAWGRHGAPNLDAWIIIGRRRHKAEHLERIQQFERSMNISIRSYDF